HRRQRARPSLALPLPPGQGARPALDPGRARLRRRAHAGGVPARGAGQLDAVARGPVAGARAATPARAGALRAADERGGAMNELWRTGFSASPGVLAAALAIDWAFGELPAVAHPVVWMGQVARRFERALPSEG